MRIDWSKRRRVGSLAARRQAWADRATIDPVSFRRALMEAGIWDAVKNAIDRDATPPAIRALWGSVRFDRKSPLMTALVNQTDLTDADVNAWAGWSPPYPGA